jgi:hypothetical protein
MIGGACPAIGGAATCVESGGGTGGMASGRTAGMRVESMRTAAISVEPSVESE